ncbi:MAG: extracellular solute-binding protein [Clostridia bacterium]|nr:extracellular solute-binding protein [Clostridia bacterium]
MKKFLSLVLALLMTLGCFSALAEEIPYYKVTSDLYEFYPLDDKTITLEIYSQLANYNGLQTGWSATLLKDLFNVEVVIIPDQDGTYETRMADGNLGDIVVWGANGEDYKQAVKKDMLLDWDEDDMGATYAPYIFANYGDALNTNRVVSENNDTLYGFGMDVALQEGAHKSFMYSWDLRWDLYSQLGYPEIKNLDDLIEVFKKMKEICPTDENGNETYAASLWPDWDGNMVMYVKALATAYYGYDELGFGLYDPNTGDFYDALMDNGPYIEMLKFFNKLYRADLLDPNSMTQTYDQMGEKVKNGGVFWGIFNYASSMTYNTTKHLDEGKMMYARVPDEANPIVYGMSTLGGSRIWSVGNYTAYPELCLAILDFLATPEGSMTMWYGPRGLTWDYNEQGGMYFTELGLLTSADSKTDLNGVEWTSPYTGKTYTLSGTFNDGCLQANNTTLARDMINPDGKLGEAFNKDTWVSVQTAVSYPIQQDWRDWSGVSLVDQYFEKVNKYTVMPDLPYSESLKSDELKVKWDQCAKAITTNSWLAIYARNDGEFNFHVMNMKNQCKGYGWQDCLNWSLGEAAIKWQLQQEQEAMKAN